MHDSHTPSSPGPEPVPGLAALVVKQGVGLGGLGDAQRALALGFVWAGLPRVAMAEAGINAALKAQLAGAARCLDTDHVELRRWLVDAGWLQRDAWGREYRRSAPAQLAPAWQALGAALERAFDGGDTAGWADGLRRAREAARAARRQAHERSGAAPGPGAA